MAEFEVAIYNKEVRELVAEGSRHQNLTDEWAETHYIDVEGSDKQDARRIIQRRYPEKRGFVIDSIEKKIY
ncbi:MAG: hypothetical protein HN731_05855 [Rhodospirillaceae bacterium]|jgi:hypothetical protein|nr:hypothetical protein [Rhodospirillaceae bacterium]